MHVTAFMLTHRFDRHIRFLIQAAFLGLVLLLTPRAFAQGAPPTAAPPTAAPPVAAPTAEFGAACAEAYAATQELRLELKLLEAREKAAFCVQEACPSAVRSGCTKWVTELIASQPTIAVSATGADGGDVSDVVVEIDGRRATEALTGAPLEINPGKRSLRFTHRGLVRTQEIVVTEGIKNRAIVVDFVDPTVRKKVAPPLTPALVDEPRGAPVGAYILGGVGVISLGAFAALAVTGTADLDELRDTCGVTATCTSEQVDDAKTKLIAGDVLLGVGALALGSGTVWLIVHYASSGPSRERSSAAVRWSVGPARGGAYGNLSFDY